jgi:hypothetical protein
MAVEQVVLGAILCIGVVCPDIGKSLPTDRPSHSGHFFKKYSRKLITKLLFLFDLQYDLCITTHFSIPLEQELFLLASSISLTTDMAAK